MPLLCPGRNCWKISDFDRAAFLIDADAYFEAFAEAAERARKTIFLTAWDIDGLISLNSRRPQENLRTFFLRLLRQKPELEIFILNWKFNLAYSDDRELLPLFDSPWQTHPRLHFVWDAAHPIGACHHQKVVVIDDTL